MNQWRTTNQLRRQFGIKPHNVHAWYRRHPDRIKRISCRGTLLFWLPDVLRYWTQNHVVDDRLATVMAAAAAPAAGEDVREDRRHDRFHRDLIL